MQHSIAHADQCLQRSNKLASVHCCKTMAKHSQMLTCCSDDLPRSRTCKKSTGLCATQHIATAPVYFPRAFRHTFTWGVIAQNFSMMNKNVMFSRPVNCFAHLSYKIEVYYAAMWVSTENLHTSFYGCALSVKEL